MKKGKKRNQCWYGACEKKIAAQYTIKLIYEKWSEEVKFSGCIEHFKLAWPERVSETNDFLGRQ